jgi:RimJ/RimL family protein N-acetyltransferase
MEPIALTTHRLLLRPVGPDDTDAIHAACQDPDIQRWTSLPSPYLREHAEDFAGRVAPESWNNGTEYAFAAVTRDAGVLVAVMGIGIRGREPGLAEVGYWAVKEHRGRGHVTEALRTLSRWAFTDAGIERLEWRAEVGNAASRAVAEKAGFTIEGTLRAAVVHGGTRRDCWFGALLPSDLGLPSATAYLPALA